MARPTPLRPLLYGLRFHGPPGDNGAMRLRFTKMQGAGNDFLVLDGIRQALELNPARVRTLAAALTSDTEFSMRTVTRSSSAATARGVS